MPWARSWCSGSAPPGPGWFGSDLLFLRLGLQVASGLVLGGLLAKLLVGALHRTGVVDSFAIGPYPTARTPESRVSQG